jgi:hypothetical protein
MRSGWKILAQRAGDERRDRRNPDRVVSIWFGGWPVLLSSSFPRCFSRPDRHVVLLRPAPVRAHELEQRDDWSIQDAALDGSVPTTIFRRSCGGSPETSASTMSIIWPAGFRSTGFPKSFVTMTELARSSASRCATALGCARLALWDENHDGSSPSPRQGSCRLDPGAHVSRQHNFGDDNMTRFSTEGRTATGRDLFKDKKKKKAKENPRNIPPRSSWASTAGTRSSPAAFQVNTSPGPFRNRRRTRAG